MYNKLCSANKISKEFFTHYFAEVFFFSNNITVTLKLLSFLNLILFGPSIWLGSEAQCTALIFITQYFQMPFKSLTFWSEK